MHALLRCDASRGGGIGHLVRCLAIADAARERGWQVSLSGTFQVELARRLIARAGVAVVPPADEGAALAHRAREVGADIVHVDHYGLDPGLRVELARFDVPLSSVEDGKFGRRPADLVVDPTPGAERGGRPEDESRLVLLGPEFVPLRRSVRAARQRSIVREVSEGPPAALVVLGGTDATGLLSVLVAEATRGPALPRRLTVVAPAGHDPTSAAIEATQVAVVDAQDDLPSLAADHDVVLGASGTSVWELACIGLAQGIVAVVENQQAGYRRALDAGVAVGLGSAEELRRGDRRAHAVLQRLFIERDLRSSLAASGRRLVDGHGARRVVEAWEGLVGDVVTARPARLEDADRLRAWRNDPATRVASRTIAEVDVEAHRRWLVDVVADPGRQLFVVERRDEAVGTVRFDRRSNQLWEVSITVAPEARGQRLAPRVLAAAESVWRDESTTDAAVLACIRPGNAASERLFRAAGYEPAPSHSTGEVDAYVKW